MPRPNRARRARKPFAQKPSRTLLADLPAYIGWDPLSGRYRDPYRDWKERQRNKRPA